MVRQALLNNGQLVNGTGLKVQGGHYHDETTKAQRKQRNLHFDPKTLKGKMNGDEIASSGNLNKMAIELGKVEAALEKGKAPQVTRYLRDQLIPTIGQQVKCTRLDNQCSTVDNFIRSVDLMLRALKIDNSNKKQVLDCLTDNLIELGKKTVSNSGVRFLKKYFCLLDLVVDELRPQDKQKILKSLDAVSARLLRIHFSDHPDCEVDGDFLANSIQSIFNTNTKLRKKQAKGKNHKIAIQLIKKDAVQVHDIFRLPIKRTIRAAAQEGQLKDQVDYAEKL